VIAETAQNRSEFIFAEQISQQQKRVACQDKIDGGNRLSLIDHFYCNHYFTP
jgi:hypothetical protein